MKLQHCSKFKIPKNIMISKGEKDDIGFTNCYINQESNIAVEVDSVVFRNGESGYSIKLQESVFSNNIKNLENVLISKLHSDAMAIFGKEFPLEKFQKAFNTPLKEEQSELTVNISEKSKILDKLGNDIKSKIEEHTELEGRCIVKLRCLRFITTYIYCDWELVYFKESMSYDEDSEEEQEPEEKVVEEKVIEQEESFF
jgi:hypothetical protein